MDEQEISRLIAERENCPACHGIGAVEPGKVCEACRDIWEALSVVPDALVPDGGW